MKEIERISNDFGSQKKLLSEARKSLNNIKEMTFEEWKMNKRQLELEFPNQ